MLDASFLTAARDLIRADSVTDRGNLPAVRVLEPICEAAGLPVLRQPSRETGDRDANLLAGPGGGPEASGDPVLLVTHLDTVDPGPRDRWKTDPFDLAVEGDRARGLGVADVKLDALCKLWAARRLKDTPLKRPFYFLGTFGEEAGLRGARELMAAPPFKPSAVLCGEPSELIICHAHKGYAVMSVRIVSRAGTTFASSPAAVVSWRGKAAHSSTPALGVNAIDLALDALSAPGVPYAMAIHGGISANTIPASCDATVYMRAGCGPSLWKSEDRPPPHQDTWANVTSMLPLIRELLTLWRSSVANLEPKEDPRFEPSMAVASVTRIRTEHDAVELTLDARLLPEHDVGAFLSAFKLQAASLATDQFDVQVRVDRSASGMSLSETHPLVLTVGEVLESLGLSGVPRAKPTSTEAGVFANAGYPAIVFGPSRSTGNAHTANEEARLDQVERAIDVYEAVLRRLCG
jgi:acetylornithine deacetylase/succinyl-diaminopimelate desuccinylase-like protein